MKLPPGHSIPRPVIQGKGLQTKLAAPATPLSIHFEGRCVPVIAFPVELTPTTHRISLQGFGFGRGSDNQSW
jgi:hypothetical protein